VIGENYNSQKEIPALNNKPRESNMIDENYNSQKEIPYE